MVIYLIFKQLQKAGFQGKGERDHSIVISSWGFRWNCMHHCPRKALEVFALSMHLSQSWHEIKSFLFLECPTSSCPCSLAIAVVIIDLAFNYGPQASSSSMPQSRIGLDAITSEY